MKSITGLISVIFFLFANNLSAQIMQPVALSSNSGSLAGTPDQWGRPAPDSRGWTDPALNHNKLLQQRTGDGVYQLIGNYKVTGNCYLFGVHNKGDMFATEAKAYNIYLNYNTYNQELEFYTTSNPNEPLVKEPGTVDSFTIQVNEEAGITNPLKFVYGTILGTKDKYYFQEVCKGPRFCLYKRYKSELGYSSSNLGQTELRQFELQVEYYYTDTQNKGIKKIKPNQASVVKEFKEIMDLSSIVSIDDFTQNPEMAFCKALSQLNQQKGF